MSSEKKRYAVVKGSQTGHGCCFDATIVDTSRPQLVGDDPYKDPNGNFLYTVVGEFFSEDVATRICDLLNAEEQDGAARTA